ncbi:hypothetical protein T06_8545 [Trichinella sp. T6]|nr:hypothetical protein T06_8545 [Trichinella sp. T6]
MDGDCKLEEENYSVNLIQDIRQAVTEAAYDAVKAFLVRRSILNSSRNSVHSFRTSGCNSSQKECLRFVETCQQIARNYQAKVSKQHSQPMGNEVFKLTHHWHLG